MRPEVVGYASSFVLLVTISSQLFTVWRSRSSAGVSPLLFAGQFIASTGFLVYSVLVRDPVFIVTNASLAIAALVGVAIRRLHQGAQLHG